MLKAYVYINPLYNLDTGAHIRTEYWVKSFGTHALLAIFNSREAARQHCRTLNYPNAA